jgi:ribosomal protein S18 acetylase RimI-like enzyme
MPPTNNSLMKIVFRPWQELDLAEIASLISLVRKDALGIYRAVSNNEAINFLDENSSSASNWAALAFAGGELVGWLLLAAEGSDAVEVNPSVLGGHPIVARGVDRPATAGLLLDEATRWAEGEGIGRVNLVTGMAEEDKEDDAFATFYEQHSFGLKLKYVEMICQLSDVLPLEATLPPGFEIAPLSTATMDELYNCYHQAFAAGDARFFFDQDPAEQRDYFDTLGYPEAVPEPASIILRRDGRLVGFVYVMPHGEENRHISCMCVLPQLQGQGLGRLLLYEVMNRVAQQGHQSITLGTEPEMRAYDLYRKNGFQVTDGTIIYAWQNSFKA